MPREKAGVVLYQLVPGAEPQVLLVSSRKHPGSWVLPVGSVEHAEPLAAAAQRECEEETGYVVELGRQLNAVKVAGKKRTQRFTFFLATRVAQASNWERDRQQRWVQLSELLSCLPEVFHAVAQQAVELIRELDAG